MAENDEDGAAGGRRGRRVREVSAEEMNGFRDDLRYLIDQTDWSVAELNLALGLPRKSGALRNILYDKNNRVGTTRARYDALRRIRAEDLTPGIKLLDAPEEDAPKRRGGGRNNNGAAAATNGRGPRRPRRSALSLEEAAPADPIEVAASGDTPAVVLNMGGTRFTARQQGDGTWLVNLSATCTSEQLASWTRRVLNDGLAGAMAPPAAGAAAEAEEAAPAA